MLLEDLPEIRGSYEFDFPLKKLSFLKVGGTCDVLFLPSDVDDLENFLKNRPENLRLTILGNMSNVLLTDRRIQGCVIILNNLDKIEFLNDFVEVEAGAILLKFITRCAKENISCCEKLFCIPGSIGGAVAMNAGIPNFEIKDVLIAIEAINLDGKRQIFRKDELNMSYRNGNVPDGFIVTSAKLRTIEKNGDIIFSEIKSLYEKRLKTQPIGLPTCGSTFKNPEGMKAWELIKKAGCDKLSIGGAKISDMHCNFLINSGNATASDFVKLIEEIKKRVFEETGYQLEEEIRRIGDEW